jgi:Family of unknown function (DUF5343)
MDMASEVENTTLSPPYMAWTTLENALERMGVESVPSRIDRSYLVSWSGSAQAQFLKAARFLDLLDEYGRPTELLKQLVAEPDARPRLIGELIEQKYPEARALGTTATHQELEEVFRSYDGISGGTVTKAISFYLSASRYAGLTLSPFFRSARPGVAGTKAPRRPTRKRAAVKPAADSQQNGGDAGMTSGLPSGLHPALAGLLGDLPKRGETWTKAEQAMFKKAFAAILPIAAPTSDGDDGGDEEGGDWSE